MRRLWVDRLFVPLTAVRFRRIFSALDPTGSPGRSSVRLAQITVRGILRPGNPKSNGPIDILWLLHEAMIEQWLAKLEASIRGGTLVLDEGLLERGVGVWLRAPEERRDAAWTAFLAAVPTGLRCLMLTCPPQVAFQRAGLRPRGIGAVARWAPNGASPDEWAEQHYPRITSLMEHAASDPRLRVHLMDSALDSDTLADDVRRLVGAPLYLLARE